MAIFAEAGETKVEGQALADVTVDASRPGAAATPFSYGDVVKATLPGVVTVFTSHYRAKRPVPSLSGTTTFDLPPRQPPLDVVNEDRSLGSGVIISNRGFILTNHHVIHYGEDIRVRVPGRDGDLPAKMVGTDPATDIALLKIDAPGLQAIKIADSENLQQGDVVLAFGSPFGLEQTVTMGIVSAKSRSLNLIRAGYEDFIQTDAAMSSGNSGGALTDALGRLVGINSAALTGDYGPASRVGFAIPVNLALKVARDLLAKDHVVRGFLGLQMRALSTEETQAYLHRREPQPAEVTAIESGAPADKAGFKRGDVILSVNNLPAPSTSRARYLIAVTPPGLKIGVKILRAGQVLTLETVPTEMPVLMESQPKVALTTEEPPFFPKPGLELRTLTQQGRFERKLPASLYGVLVVKAPAVAGEGLRLEAGDVITATNGTGTPSIAVLKTMLGQTHGANLLKVWRAGTELFIALSDFTPEKAAKP
jgi:S1-C subfamily serine protease